MDFKVLFLNRIGGTETDIAAAQKNNGKLQRKKKWEEFGDVTLQGKPIVAGGIVRSKVECF